MVKQGGGVIRELEVLGATGEKRAHTLMYTHTHVVSCRIYTHTNMGSTVAEPRTTAALHDAFSR